MSASFREKAKGKNLSEAAPLEGISLEDSELKFHLLFFRCSFKLVGLSEMLVGMLHSQFNGRGLPADEGGISVLAANPEG